MRKLVVAVVIFLVLAASVSGWFFYNYQKNKAAKERVETLSSVLVGIGKGPMFFYPQINKTLLTKGVVIDYSNVHDSAGLEKDRLEYEQYKDSDPWASSYYSAQIIHHNKQIYAYHIEHQATTFATDYFPDIIKENYEISTKLLPEIMLLDNAAQFRKTSSSNEGSTLNFMSFGWIELASLIANFGAYFFENGSLLMGEDTTPVAVSTVVSFDEIVRNDMPLEQRRVFLAENFRNVEDIIEKQEKAFDGKASKGILWLEYYPCYQGIWLMAQGFSEKELSEAQFFIDGKAWTAQINYPLAFLEGVPADAHTFSINSRSYSSEIPLLNQGVNFLVRDYRLESDKLTITIYSYNQSLTISKASFVSEAGNCNLAKSVEVTAENETNIVLSCSFASEPQEKIFFETEISYSASGKSKTINGAALLRID